MLTFPLQCFLNDKNIFHINFTHSLTFQWKLLVMAYYSTVPITCTQTRIHQTQSLHYDKSLKCSSLRHIVTTNFAARIYRLLCEILGSFRLDYEYEIEYEYDFSIVVFRLHIITIHTHFIP